MNSCWPDGDLRAHVDGELDRQELACHLEICAACSARYRELSERAARVSGLMATLSEEVAAAAPPRAHRRRRWAVAALALAAALAIGFVVLPRRSAVRRAPLAKAPAAAIATPAPIAAARPAVRPTAERRQPVREDFLQLDDEPLETGVIVRVSAENGDVQADLVVGPDGRAHAIRVVSNQ